MMLVSRTPLRVSFFGGGTDYPEYFENSRGSVVGMAIDKYVYISALRLNSALNYRYRLSYSKIETTQRIEDLEHPVVSKVLQHWGIDEPLDLSIMADLPARSGLGSSSSFTVGLLNLVHTMKNKPVTKLDLANEAVFVERGLLQENVGVQDQHHASFGGLNKFDFQAKRTRLTPIQQTAACQEVLNSSLYLIYTGINRYASQMLDEQMEKTRSGAVQQDLSHLLSLADQAVSVLEGDDPDQMLKDLGAMLHEGWETKKRLSSKITNPHIDEIYTAAREVGALGGKLCGAGSGGFLLVLIPPYAKAAAEERFAKHGLVPIKLDCTGSTIISS